MKDAILPPEFTDHERQLLELRDKLHTPTVDSGFAESLVEAYKEAEATSLRTLESLDDAICREMLAEESLLDESLEYVSSDQRDQRNINVSGGPPARKTGGWVALVLAALVVVNLYVLVWDKQTSVGAIKREADRATPMAMVPSRPMAEPAGSGACPAPATLAIVPAPVGPPGVVDGKVGKSDTLGRVLKKSGLTETEADEVIRALSGVFDFKTMRAGHARQEAESAWMAAEDAILRVEPSKRPTRKLKMLPVQEQRRRQELEVRAPGEVANVNVRSNVSDAVPVAPAAPKVKARPTSVDPYSSPD